MDFCFLLGCRSRSQNMPSFEVSIFDIVAVGVEIVDVFVS